MRTVTANHARTNDANWFGFNTKPIFVVKAIKEEQRQPRKISHDTLLSPGKPAKCSRVSPRKWGGKRRDS